MDPQCRLGVDELRDPLLSDSQQFGIEERPGLVDAVVEQFGLLDQLLAGRQARVLRQLFARKHVQA